MLHLYALPRLNRLDFFAARLGGVSASSGLFAAFLGVARPIAALLTYGQFMGAYVLVLMAGLFGAAVVFRSQHKQSTSRSGAFQAYLGYPGLPHLPQVYPA